MLTCTEIFQAAFQLAPMAFVIGTLQSFFSSFSEIVLPVSLCYKLFFRISITRVSNHKKVVEKTAAQPAPCKPIPTCGDVRQSFNQWNFINEFLLEIKPEGQADFPRQGSEEGRSQ